MALYHFSWHSIATAKLFSLNSSILRKAFLFSQSDLVCVSLWITYYFSFRTDTSDDDEEVCF